MNSYTEEKISSSPRIDLVYLWCDGNEPFFKEKKRKVRVVLIFRGIMCRLCLK